MPTKLVPVEITEPIAPILSDGEYDSVQLLVTVRGVPIGYVSMANRQFISAEDVRYSITHGLPSSAIGTMAEMLLRPVSRPDEGVRPSVSIVLCTLDRPDDLADCLDAIVQSDYPNYEIVLVDNNPSSGKTRAVAERYPVVYVEETRRGLSFARNAGIRAANGEIIVCTDDDCIVDKAWLDRLVRPFEDPQVGCVTGLVVPAELETRSQELFELYGGLGRGFERKVFDRKWFEQSKSRAVHTWIIGATAIAAFRASSLQEIGLFEESLFGSEDTYVFYQLLRLGYKCVYEPWAYVFHKHRSEYKSLRRQLFHYSKGHYAYHTKCFLAHRDLRALVHMWASVPQSYIWRMRSSLRRKSKYPFKLILWEILGNIIGPFAYLRSMVRTKRLLQESANDGTA